MLEVSIYYRWFYIDFYCNSGPEKIYILVRLPFNILLKYRHFFNVCNTTC